MLGARIFIPTDALKKLIVQPLQPMGTTRAYQFHVLVLPVRSEHVPLRPVPELMAGNSFFVLT